VLLLGGGGYVEIPYKSAFRGMARGKYNGIQYCTTFCTDCKHDGLLPWIEQW
jgi:hypothetical protein